MSLSLSEAKVLQKKAQQVVDEMAAQRDEAQATLNGIRDELKTVQGNRTASLVLIEQLKEKLRSTQHDMLPTEMASKRAAAELDAAQKELAKAREERIAAEAMLVLLEKERDQAERLLDGAQEDLEKSDEIEHESRADLDKNTRLANNAQQAMDQALRAIDDAKTAVEQTRTELFRARAAGTSLPRKDSSLGLVVEQRKAVLDEVSAEAATARSEYDELRTNQQEADELASTVKQKYEQAQEDLKKAVAAKLKAEAHLRAAEQLPGLDDMEREQLAAAQREHDDAVARFEEAQEQNKTLLGQLADADVETIRCRITAEESKKTLDEVEGRLSVAQKEYDDACKEAARNASEREANSKEVLELEAKLKESEERLRQLESEGKAATEENETAQRGLKDMQEIAMRYGRESRNAASILDGRRHKLSDIVSAIEVGRTQLVSLKRREEERAARVDITYSENQTAQSALTESRGFLTTAQKSIDDHLATVAQLDKEIEAINARIKNAEDELFAAQTDLQIAQSDLTDAEVSVIMAQIL